MKRANIMEYSFQGDFEQTCFNTSFLFTALYISYNSISVSTI